MFDSERKKKTKKNQERKRCNVISTWQIRTFLFKHEQRTGRKILVSAPMK